MTSIGMTSHCMTSRYGVHFCIESVNRPVPMTCKVSIRYVAWFTRYLTTHYFQDDPRIYAIFSPNYNLAKFFHSNWICVLKRQGKTAFQLFAMAFITVCKYNINTFKCLQNNIYETIYICMFLFRNKVFAVISGDFIHIHSVGISQYLPYFPFSFHTKNSTSRGQPY